MRGMIMRRSIPSGFIEELTQLLKTEKNLEFKKKLSAIRLALVENFTVRKVAENMGCSLGSVSEWVNSALIYGLESLRPKNHPGSKPKLTKEQKEFVSNAL